MDLSYFLYFTVMDFNLLLCNSFKFTDLQLERTGVVRAGRSGEARARPLPRRRLADAHTNSAGRDGCRTPTHPDPRAIRAPVRAVSYSSRITAALCHCILVSRHIRLWAQLQRECPTAAADARRCRTSKPDPLALLCESSPIVQIIVVMLSFTQGRIVQRTSINLQFD